MNKGNSPENKKPVVHSGRWTRRRFLVGAAAAGLMLPAATVTYARYWEPFAIQVTELELPIRHLPASMVNKRLIQVSDLHVGPVVDPRHLEHAFAQLHNLSGDMLVVTGDFVSYDRTMEPWSILKSLFNNLPEFRLGIYGIVGNHDYGEDWSQPDVAHKLFETMADTPLQFLHNDVVDIDGFQLAGVGDLWTESYDPESMFAKLDPEQAKLVLCHNPDAIDRPEFRHYDSWMLSGHTHGGQCWFPLVGTPIVPVRNRRYNQGALVSDSGKARLYINSGLGYTRQIRFMVPPEITVFTLRLDDSPIS